MQKIRMPDFFSDIDFNNLKPARGKALISEPFLFDPNFKRTVVLLTEHNEDGSVGFILNRPVNLKLSDAIEDFPEFESELYYGGPVGQGSLFYIHTLKELEDSKGIMKGLHWGGDFEKLRFLIDTKQIEPKQIRFFLGYSGWDAGQLDRELEEKSWIVANCKASQVMNGNQQDFWKDTLKRLGKKYAIMANFPEDPTLN